jgi:YVTN family beta-propeller protein
MALSASRAIKGVRRISIAVLLVLVIGIACTEPSDDAPTSEESPTPSSVQTPSTTDSTPPSPEPSEDDPELLLARSTSSSAVAVSPSGDLVIAVNPDSGSVSLVNAINLVPIGEVLVGRDPRTVAFNPAGSAAFVANFGAGTVTRIDLGSLRVDAEWMVGPTPYGIVVSEQLAYVSHLATGLVTVLDIDTGEIVDTVHVGDFPAGLALTRQAKTLLVTHLFSGELAAIDTQSLSIDWTISTGSRANLSQFVVVTPDGQTAYLPQTRSNPDNTARLFDSTVSPVVTAVSLSVPEANRSLRINLETADESVNMPFAAVLSAAADTMFVANAGSNDVSVIDLTTGRGARHIAVGANPRGIAITPDGSRVFVNNVLDGTLSVINSRTLRVERTVTLTDIPMDEQVLLGKRLFNDAANPALARDQWISCATCHFDGMHDARTWVDFPDGPRNTPSLLGVRDTLPIHWSGDLDELQDVELTIRAIQNGTGLVAGSAHDSLGVPYTGLSDELDALAAYLVALEPVSLPSDLNLTGQSEGKEVFEQLGCATCHAAPLYTDLSMHDVGTGNAARERNTHGRGTTFDTPSLRGVRLTGPYFHDGSASTLAAVLETRNSDGAHAVTDRLTAAEIDSLIAFLRSL